MKRQSTAWPLTKICEDCGCTLHTKKEWDQGRCERCHEWHEEKIHALYGDE